MTKQIACLSVLLTLLFPSVAVAYNLDIAADKEFGFVGDTVEFTATIENTTGTPQTNLKSSIYFILDTAVLISKPESCTVESFEFESGVQTWLDCSLADLGNGESTSFQLSVMATQSNHFGADQMSAGLFLSQNDEQIANLRDDTFVWIYHDTTTDTDGDNASDFNEVLRGTNPADINEKPGTTFIDILALYSPGAVSVSEGDVEARLDHIVSYSNLVLMNSGIDVELRILAQHSIDFADEPSNSSALSELDARNGVFATVDTLRNQAGADLMVFFRPSSDPSSCGIANIGGYLTHGDFSNDYNAANATSIVNIDCPDNTLIHELGHNLGLQHSRVQDGTGGTFPYALGYGIQNDFVTTMAYAASFGLTSAGEIDLFSNDGLVCNGSPCGIDRNNQTDGADAVFTIKTVADQVASYREVVDFDGDGTPDVDDTDDDNDGTLDVDDAFPHDATEDTDTDNDGIGNNGDLDDDNDGFPDSEELAAGSNPLDALSFPDVVAPVLSVPDELLIVDAEGVGIPKTDDRIVTFLTAVTASDDVDGTIQTISNDAPETFSLGATTVTFTATDNAGNIGSATGTVAIASALLDVDADGEVGALTDGLLILRYMFGFRGDVLITGAVESSCNRCTGPEVELYIRSTLYGVQN